MNFTRGIHFGSQNLKHGNLHTFGTNYLKRKQSEMFYEEYTIEHIKNAFFSLFIHAIAPKFILLTDPRIM